MGVRAVLDINVWLDIATRAALYPESDLLFNKLTKSTQVGFALCGYTTFYYLLSRALGSKIALEFITLMRTQPIDWIPFEDNDVILAHKLEFKDHEDACLAASASRNGYTLIATRNVKDFRSSPIPAYEPKAIISKFLTR